MTAIGRLLTLAVALCAGLNPATAQSPALKYVPADAALFAHIDVAKLMSGKFGEIVRTLEIPNETDPFEDKPGDKPKTVRIYQDFQTKFLAATGVDLNDISTVTLYMPKLKGPGDEQTIVVAVSLTKPVDETKLLTGLAKLNPAFGELKQKEPGIVAFERGGKLAFLNSNTVLILGDKVKAIPGERSGSPGVIAPAIDAAAKGTTAVLSLNFANFPEEIKGDDLPAEVRPFLPLIRSELNYLEANVVGDRLDMTVHVRSESRAKSIEAEKALGALVTFAKTGLAVLAVQMDKQKEKEKELVPFIEFVKNVQDAVKGAKFASSDNEATLAMSLKIESSIATAAAGAMTAMQGASSRSVTSNNLKQMGLAMHNYHDVMNQFPGAAICDKDGKPLLSWRVAILPYIEQDNLYKLFKLDEAWDSGHNKKVFENYPIPKVFLVPGVDSPNEKKTRFRVFVAKDKEALPGGFDWKPGLKITSITDGTSNTGMIFTAKDSVAWTKPDALEYSAKGNPADLLFFQNNVTPVGFFDGSVRYLPKTISANDWRALVTRSGGEVINVP